MRNINLDQLRTLLEVVQCRSFSAAARRLNLSQPAVSLQIRELERRYGVRLIERFGKQAHATEPGRELLESAHRIFSECAKADERMRQFRDNWVGRVHVSTTLTAMIYRLPPILRELRNDHPGIDLVVSNMPTAESIAKIMQNEVDLALVTLPVDDAQLQVVPLCHEEMVAVFPAEMKDIPEEVTPDTLAERRLLLLTEQTTSAGYPLVMAWVSPETATMPLGTIEALKSAVASNLGVAILPDVAVSHTLSDFVVRPMRPGLSRMLALVEHRNKPNDAALDIVRNALLALPKRTAPTRNELRARAKA